ncbi:MAG: RNA polymerase sigma factor [Clostridiales bacterium]|nr:RNA polymerase sigma factor [Clostridiales bacterium]
MEDFERIYSAYSPAVYRLGVLYLKNGSAAEDVTQDCFVKLLERGGFQSESHIKAWLLTVARNLCFNALRRAKRQVPLDEYIPAAPDGRAVMSEMYALPPDDRAAVYLFYYEGYASREIARFLQTTDAAVRARLKRARAKLKQILEDVNE